MKASFMSSSHLGVSSDDYSNITGTKKIQKSFTLPTYCYQIQQKIPANYLNPYPNLKLRDSIITKEDHLRGCFLTQI